MNKKPYEQLDSGISQPNLAQEASGIAQSAHTTSVNPAQITQSYYKNPSDLSNYEQPRPTYQQGQAVTDAGDALVQHEQNKPQAYESSYAGQIQGMIDQILNRGNFQYDFTADPLYQQYAQQYQRNGQLAMKDAMAQSAALTGGYGNSYAQQVGQQGYQRWMENLNAVIPELQQAAYNRYLNEGDNMRANLGMLQSADDTAYGRYRDTVGDYQNELAYLYGKFNDMSQQEYNRYLNDAAAWEADRAYWHQRALEEEAKAGSGGGGRRKSASSMPELDQAASNALNVGGLSGLNGVPQNGSFWDELPALSNESSVPGNNPVLPKMLAQNIRQKK